MCTIQDKLIDFFQTQEWVFGDDTVIFNVLDKNYYNIILVITGILFNILLLLNRENVCVYIYIYVYKVI
jgi:hypothetical protein